MFSWQSKLSTKRDNRLQGDIVKCQPVSNHQNDRYAIIRGAIQKFFHKPLG